MRKSRLLSVGLHYGLACISVALAAALTRLLKDFGDAGISPLLFAAVMLSAWYGGMGPGFLATILSGIATAWLLLAPRGWTQQAIQDEILRLAVFTVVCVLTGSLHGAIRRAADASRRAKEAAESASAAKSKFLAMISHELRTPLSPVLIAADMLERDPAMPQKLLPDLRTIRRNIDLEIRLIQDLMDLTSITSEKMRLATELIDVHHPIRAAMAVCEADWREKKIDLMTQFCDHPVLVSGDPIRLQQVFWNLLRNAIKFTPAGGKISIQSRRLTDDTVAVEISDNGIGIDPDRLARIFDAFEQGGADIGARFGGLGLGLAISQALVAAHQGSIQAISDGKGTGATFRVILPTVARERDGSFSGGREADSDGAGNVEKIANP